MLFDLQKVRAAFPGREIHWHDSIASTMPAAVELAAKGAATGTVIGADEQTAGHGRFHRTWHSEKGTGLYQTVIIRQEALQPVITLALGLATKAAIESTTKTKADLRWPNDVLINEKKVAGILVQSHGNAVIAGIGINVNQSAFPEDVAAIATSLRIETGQPHNREDLFIALLQEIDNYRGLSLEDILRAFTMNSSYVTGRRVIVDDLHTGTTAGLTPDGFLKLTQDDGTEHIVLAGGVRPCS